MEFKHAHTEEAAIKCSEWPAPTLRPIHKHTHTHTHTCIMGVRLPVR